MHVPCPRSCSRIRLDLVACYECSDFLKDSTGIHARVACMGINRHKVINAKKKVYCSHTIR